MKSQMKNYALVHEHYTSAPKRFETYLVPWVGMSCDLARERGKPGRWKLHINSKKTRWRNNQKIRAPKISMTSIIYYKQHHIHSSVSGVQ